MAAFATGCTFMLFQAAAYAGLIEIKWAAIEHKLEEVLDGARVASARSRERVGGGAITNSPVSRVRRCLLRQVATSRPYPSFTSTHVPDCSGRRRKV